MTALQPIAINTLTVATPPMPTIEKHRDRLLEAYGAHSGLVAQLKITDQDLAACLAEADAADSARPTAKFAREAALFLVSSWPQHKGPADPKVFVTHLVEVMLDTPPDLIAPAIRFLVRSVRYLPSVAEFLEAVETVREKRSALHHGAKRIDRWRRIETGLSIEQRIAHQLPAPPASERR